MTHKEKAISNFDSGLNCAQSVIGAFSETMCISEEICFAVACGFGGGMGRQQSTCGAVTGAYMVIGAEQYKKTSVPAEQKENAYRKVREFSDKFMAVHNTLSCKELLQVDLNTEAGHQAMKDLNLRESVCKKCIMDAVGITEYLLK